MIVATPITRSSGPAAPSPLGQRFRSCHPDHLATGELALRAVYPDAGNPFALTFLREQEGLEPWTAEEIWLINSPRVNHSVDVADT